MKALGSALTAFRKAFFESIQAAIEITNRHGHVVLPLLSHIHDFLGQNGWQHIVDVILKDIRKGGGSALNSLFCCAKENLGFFSFELTAAEMLTLNKM